MSRVDANLMWYAVPSYMALSNFFSSIEWGEIMRLTYGKPTIVSEQCFETSALGCGKTPTGGSVHLGSGSTTFTGHGFGTTSYTPGMPYHHGPGFTSLQTPAFCNDILFSS